MSEKTNRESDKFMLRLPENMRDRIRSSAEQNRRSMNAEIVQALEAHLAIEEHRVEGTASDGHPYDETTEFVPTRDDIPATKADIDIVLSLIKRALKPK